MPTPHDLSQSMRLTIARDFASMYKSLKEDEPFADISYVEITQDIAMRIGPINGDNIDDILMLEPDTKDGKFSGVLFYNMSGKYQYSVNIEAASSPPKKKMRLQEIATGKGGTRKEWIEC